ncbi:ankyrin [Amniculicola lignicola CBS 123094]|uniref:Ankyrin n=1 Tax=Amniculicola lignicola CBS 123094 TaxID=1392246 RepID=A0A6A5X035_9PLEO|nr:ankyrin [Amniculicola lignicola CBS 123094]
MVDRVKTAGIVRKVNRELRFPLEAYARKDGPTPLCVAAARGYKKTVELLLADPPLNPDYRGASKETPLEWATNCGHVGIVKMLLQDHRVSIAVSEAEGSVLIAPMGRGHSTLIWAGHYGNFKVAKRLLGKGVDVNFRSAEGGTTPLFEAAEHGNMETVQLLLDQPISMSTTSRMALLLDARVDINAQESFSASALQASYKNEMLAKLLLSKGADIHVRDGYYGNALQAFSPEWYR